MTRVSFVILAAALAAGCGNSVTGPDATGFTGNYTFVLTPATTCSFTTSYTFVLVASTAKDSTGYQAVRATLPGGNNQVDVSFLYDPNAPANVVAGDLTINNPSSTSLSLFGTLTGHITTGARYKATGTIDGEIQSDTGHGIVRCEAFHSWTLTPS